MKRRQFFTGAAGALVAGRSMGSSSGRSLQSSCGCALAPADPLGAEAFRGVGSARENHRHEGVRRLAHAGLRPPVRLREARNQRGRRRLGRGHARRQGRRGDGLHERLPRLPDRQRSDAGGASLAVDVRAQLLSRRAGHRLGDLGHRPGAVGHPRQSARPAGVPAAGRPVRRARRARLLPRQARRTRRSLQQLRGTAVELGVSCFKTGHPRLLRVDRDARRKSSARSSRMQIPARRVSARTSTSPSISTPRPARAWRRSSSKRSSR